MKLRLPTLLKNALLSCFVAASMATTIATGQSTAPYIGNITFIGDSITHGSMGDNTEAKGGATGLPSWRYAVWKNLLDNGYVDKTNGTNDAEMEGTGKEFQMVGSTTNFAESDAQLNQNAKAYNGSAFINVHEGHNGWETGRILSGSQAGGYGNISNWLKGEDGNRLSTAGPGGGAFQEDNTNDFKNNAYSPDTVVLMIGVNDSAEMNTVGNINLIIDEIRKSNPKAHIVLSTILPSYRDNDKIAGVNTALLALNGTAVGESRITAYDASRGFDYATMCYDNLHPSEQGGLIMAGNLARALGIGQRTAGLARRAVTAESSSYTPLAMNALPPQSSATTTVAGKGWSATTGSNGNPIFALESNKAGSKMMTSWTANGANASFSMELSLQMYEMNTTNVFSISMGDGTLQNGVLHIYGNKIMWGSGRTLYSASNIDGTADIRFAYLQGTTENGNKAGYYVWLNGVMIAEGLSGTGTASSGIEFGNLGASSFSYAAIQGFAYNASGAYAPEGENVRFSALEGLKRATAGMIAWQTTDFTAENNNLKATAAGVYNARLSVGGSGPTIGATITGATSGNTVEGQIYANSGDWTGDMWLTLDTPTIQTSWSGGHNTGTLTGNVNVRYIGDGVYGSEHQITGSAFFGAVSSDSDIDRVTGNVYVEFSAKNLVMGSFTVYLTGYSVMGSHNATIDGSFTAVINEGHLTRGILGGSFLGNQTCGGGAYIFVNGGTVGISPNASASIVGGGQVASTINNGSHIEVSGGKVLGNIYGGGIEGTVNGGTHLSFSGGEISGHIYGGGTGGAVVGGSAITIDGTNAASLVLKGNIYGGSNGAGTVSGGSTITLSNFAEGTLAKIGTATTIISGSGTGVVAGTKTLKLVDVFGVLQSQLQNLDRVLLTGNTVVSLTGTNTALGILEIGSNATLSLSDFAKLGGATLSGAGKLVLTGTSITVTAPTLGTFSGMISVTGNNTITISQALYNSLGSNRFEGTVGTNIILSVPENWVVDTDAALDSAITSAGASADQVGYLVGGSATAAFSLTAEQANGYKSTLMVGTGVLSLSGGTLSGDLVLYTATGGLSGKLNIVENTTLSKLYSSNQTGESAGIPTVGPLGTGGAATAIDIAAGKTLTVASGQYNGSITGAGSLSLTGTVILGGAISLSGQTTVQAGATLVISSGIIVTNSTGISMISGSTIKLDGEEGRTVTGNVTAFIPSASIWNFGAASTGKLTFTGTLNSLSEDAANNQRTFNVYSDVSFGAYVQGGYPTTMNIAENATFSFADFSNTGGAGAAIIKAGLGTLLITKSYTSGNAEQQIKLDAGTLEFGLAEGTTISLGIIISNTAATSGVLKKTGAGTLTLTRVNTYTGGTVVDGGTLKLSVGGGSGAVRGALTINSGGVVECNVGDALGYNVAVTQLRINAGGKLYQSTDNNSTFVAAITMTGGLMEWAGWETKTSTAARFDFFTNSSLTTLASAESSVIKGFINLRRDDIEFNIADGAAEHDLIIYGRVLGMPEAGGNNNLRKTGAGRLTLAWDSVINGDTSAYNETKLEAGSIQVGTGGMTGTLGKGNVTTSNNTLIIVNRSNAYTLSNTISGGGVLQTVGLGGSLTLSGNNGYSGGTIVDAGSLVAGHVSAFGTGAVTLNGGGVSMAAFAVTNAINIKDSASVFVSGSAYNGTITVGAASVLRIGAGNSIGSLNAQTMSFGAGSMLLMDIASADSYDKITISSGGSLTFGADVKMQLLLSASLASGSSFTLIDASTAATFTGGGTDPDWNPSINTDALLRGLTVTYGWNGTKQYIVTVTGTAKAVTVTWAGGASGGWSAGGLGWTGTLDGAAVNNFKNGDAVEFTAASAGDVTLTGILTPTTVLVSAGDYTFKGTGSISGATTTLTVSGGSLTVENENSYSGNTILSGGTLTIAHANALGSGKIIFSGGTLMYDARGIVDLSSRVEGAVNINTNGQTVVWTTSLGTSVTSLTKTGSGTLTLNTAASYTGGTTINGGTLKLVGKGAGGGAGGTVSGTVNINSGGILECAVADALGWNFEHANSVKALNINLGGELYQSTEDNNTISCKVTMTGGTMEWVGWEGKVNTAVIAGTAKFDLFAGSSIYTLASDQSSVMRGIVNLRQDNVEFNIADGAAQDDLIIYGQVTGVDDGVHNLRKTGAGRLTLAWNSVIQDRTSAYNETKLEAGSIQVGTGGTTGTLGQGSVTTAANTLLIFNRSNAYTLSNIISGDGTVSNVGTGVLTLSGVNTYTGGTLVEAGTILAGNVSAFGSGAITLSGASSAAVATLDRASLALTNSMIIAEGKYGRISNWGTDAATLSMRQNSTYVGNFTLSAGRTLSIATPSVAGTHVTVSGNLALSGGILTLDMTNSAYVAVTGNLSLGTAKTSLALSNVEGISVGYHLLMTTGAALVQSTIDQWLTLSGVPTTTGRAQYSLVAGDGVDNRLTSSLYLYWTEGVAQTLTWTGSKNSTWELGQTGNPSNWSGAAAGEINQYFDGDSVIFGGAAAGDITLMGTLLPKDVQVIAGAYSFVGTGILGGSTILTVTGGSVSLTTAHAATGNLTIGVAGSLILSGTGSWAGAIENNGNLTISRTETTTIGAADSTIRSLTGTGSLSLSAGSTLAAAADLTVSQAMQLGGNATLNNAGHSFTISGAITQDSTNRTLSLIGAGGRTIFTGAVTLHQLDIDLTPAEGISGVVEFNGTTTLDVLRIGATATGNGGCEVYVKGSLTTGQWIGAVLDRQRYSLNLSDGASLVITGNVSAADNTGSMVLALKGYGEPSETGDMTTFTMSGGTLSVANATMYFSPDGNVTWNLSNGVATLKGLNMANAKWSQLMMTGGELRIGSSGWVVSGSNSQTKIQLGNATLTAYEAWTTATLANIALTAAMTFQATADMGIAGVISGSSVLTKSGAGKLTLTGINTVANKLDVVAGSVELGGTAGTWAGEIALGANTSLIFAHTGNMSFGQVISGDGSLVKSGSTELTVSGNNSYTGGTAINGGSVILTGDGNLGAGDVSLSAATLDLGGKALTNAIASSGTSVLKSSSNYDGDLTIVAGDFTLDNGSATRTFGAAASLTINSGASFSMATGQTAYLAENTIVNDGTLNVGSKMYLQAAGVGNLVLGSGVLFVGADLTQGSIAQGTMSSTGGKIHFDLSVDVLDSLTLTGAFTQISGKTEFVFTSVPDSFGSNTYTLLMTTGATLDSTDFIFSGIASQGTRQQFSLTTTSAIDQTGLNLYLHAGTGSAQTLTWVGTADNNTWKQQSGLDPWTGSLDGSNEFYNADNVIFTDAAAEKNVLISGPVEPTKITIQSGDYTFTNDTVADSGIAGSASLLVSGGSLTLSGANTATGAMTIEQNGAVNFNVQDAWIGSISNSGTLNVQSADEITLGNSLTGTGDLVQKGAGKLILTGETLAVMTLSIEAGKVVQLGTGGATGSWAGAISLGDADSELILNRSGAVTLGQVTGSAGKITLTLGDLQIGGATRLGDAVNTVKLVLNGGSLVAENTNSNLSNAVEIAVNSTLNNNAKSLTLSGELTQTAGTTLTLVGAGSTIFSGQTNLETVTLNAGTLVLGSGANGATINALTVSSGITLKTGNLGTGIVSIQGKTVFGTGGGQNFTLGAAESTGVLSFAQIALNWTSTVNIKQNVEASLLNTVSNSTTYLNIDAQKTLTVNTWSNREKNNGGAGDIVKQGVGLLVIQGFEAVAGVSVFGAIDVQEGTLRFDIVTDASSSHVIKSSTDSQKTFEKTGVGKLTLNVANTATQTLDIQAGSVELGGVAGTWAGAITVAQGATLIYNHTGDFATTESNLISGAGSLEKNDDHKLTLNGVSSIADIKLSAGTLDMADKAHTSNITVAATKTASLENADKLTGTLTIAGTLTTTGNVGGTVNVANGGQINLVGAMSNTIHVLASGTINQTADAAWKSIDMVQGSTLTYQEAGRGSALILSTGKSLTVGTSTSLSGSLTIDGGIFNVDLRGYTNGTLSILDGNLLNVSSKGGIVNISSVTGLTRGKNKFVLIGGAGTLVQQGELVLSYSDLLPVNEAFLSYEGNNLVVTLDVAARLYWNGQANNSTWNMSSLNWLIDGEGGDVAFSAKDFVVFDTAAAGVLTTVTLDNNISLGGVKPTTMTVMGTSDYTFDGVGAIAAFGRLYKEGTSKLTFANAGGNVFSRGLEISEGTLAVTDASSITGDLTLAGNLELLSSGTSTLTKLTGAGSILINGEGKTVLSADNVNDYTGAVTIQKGALNNQKALSANQLHIAAMGDIALTGVTGTQIGSLSTGVAGVQISGLTGSITLNSASFVLNADNYSKPIVSFTGTGSLLSLDALTLDFSGILLDPTASYTFQLTNGKLAGGIMFHDKFGRYTNITMNGGVDYSVTRVQDGSITINSNEVFKDFVIDANNQWTPYIGQGVKAEFTADDFVGLKEGTPINFESVTVDGVMKLIGDKDFTLNNLSGTRTQAYIGVGNSVSSADIRIVSAAGQQNNYAGQLSAEYSNVTVSGNQGLGTLLVKSLILEDGTNLTLNGNATILEDLRLGVDSSLTMTGSTTSVGVEMTLGSGSQIIGTGTLQIKAGGILTVGAGATIDNEIVLDLRAGTGSSEAAGELNLGTSHITIGGIAGGGLIVSQGAGSGAGATSGSLTLDVTGTQKFTGELTGTSAEVGEAAGHIIKQGSGTQILAAKTDKDALYDLTVKEGTLVIEKDPTSTATNYGDIIVGTKNAPKAGMATLAATPSGVDTLVIKTNMTASSVTVKSNGDLILGSNGNAVNLTSAGKVAFEKGASLTMYVDTASGNGCISTTGSGTITGLSDLGSMTVVAASSWQAYVNIVLFKSEQKISGLPSNVTLEGFSGVDIHYGEGEKSIVLNASRGFDDNPYKQAMAGAGQNANAGMDLIWDINVRMGQQGSNIAANSTLAHVFDSMVAMGAGSEGANRLMAAVAGATVTSLAASQRDDFRQQQGWIRNRTVGMGISPDYVHDDLPYVNGWIQANGGTNRISEEGDEAGYNLNTFGGTVGFDLDMSARTTWGFAFTANYNKLTANGAESAKGRNDAYYANLFLRTQNKKWSNTFILTGGWNDAKLDRTVSAPGLSYVASGATQGSTFGAMYETTYDYALNEDKTSILQPLLNLSFSSATMDAYTEEGAGNAGLHVDETKNTYGTIAIGARLLGTVGENLFGRSAMGELRLQVAQDIGDDTNTANVGLGGIQREVIGTKVGKTAVQIGAGISIPVTEKGSIYMDVNTDFRSNATNVNGSIGYRINF